MRRNSIVASLIWDEKGIAGENDFDDCWPAVPRIGDTLEFEFDGAKFDATVDEVVWSTDGTVWLGTKDPRELER